MIAITTLINEATKNAAENSGDFSIDIFMQEEYGTTLNEFIRQSIKESDVATDIEVIVEEREREYIADAITDLPLYNEVEQLWLYLKYGKLPSTMSLNDLLEKHLLSLDKLPSQIERFHQ